MMRISLSRRTRAALGVLLALASILTMTWHFHSTVPRAHADGPIALNVNTGNVIQSNFLGTNAVYHGFSYMPESNAQGMTDDLRALDFDRVRGINLHIARTWYGSDWAMPTWGGAYDWNSTKMDAFYNWLQAMKDRGVAVSISAGWWFPQNVCSPAAPSTCTPRVPDDVDIYTRWVSDSLNELINVKGFTNVQYATLFTEPLTYLSGNLPDGYSVQSFYQYVVEHLQTQLVNDGRRGLVKLVGPNVGGLANDTGQLAFAANNLNDAIDIYSGHDYSLGGYGDWKALVASGISTVSATGKPFWMDEYGKQDESYRNTSDYGTYLAEADAGAMNAGVQSTLLWLYEDQYYAYPLDTITNGDSFTNGLHKWGTQPWLPSDQNVRPAWYAFSLMSRFLGGPGTKVYATTDNAGGQTINATRQPDGNWTVMVINTNRDPSSIQVNFSGAINRTFYRHVYDPANVPTNHAVIGTSAVYNNVATGFGDSLPARSVAIYTTIDDGSGGGNGSLSNGQYKLKTASNGTTYDLQLAGDAYAPCNGCGAYNIAGTPDTWNYAQQIWNLVSVGTGQYKLKTVYNGTTYDLQLTGDAYTPCNGCGAYNIAGTPDAWNYAQQIWNLVSVGISQYKLESTYNGTTYALQLTGESYPPCNGCGAYNVAATPTSWNYPQQVWTFVQ